MRGKGDGIVSVEKILRKWKVNGKRTEVRTPPGRRVLDILREDSDEDGWVSTSDLGNKLLKRYSDFDVRNYGYSKLTPFLKSLKGFEMKSVRNENSSVKQVYLREEQESDYRG